MEKNTFADEYLDLKINENVISFRDKYKKEYDVIKEFNDFFKLLQTKLCKKGNSQQNLCVMASILQLHKLYQSTILLLERGLEESANALIRSILDIMFKIVECIRNERFVDDMLIAEKYELIKTLNEIKQNKMFDMIPKERIDEYLKLCNDEIKDKYKPNMKAYTLANKNGLQKIYVLYRLQCDYTHISASVIGELIKQTSTGIYIDGDLQLKDFKKSIAWLLSITNCIFPIIIKEYVKDEFLFKNYENLVIKIEKTFKDLTQLDN